MIVKEEWQIYIWLQIWMMILYAKVPAVIQLKLIMEQFLTKKSHLLWLTMVYGEIKSLMSHPDAVNELLLKGDLIGTPFSRFEEVQFSLLALINGSEERKRLEESFGIQLDRRWNFMAKGNSWTNRELEKISQGTPNVDPISQLQL